VRAAAEEIHGASRSLPSEFPLRPRPRTAARRSRV